MYVSPLKKKKVETQLLVGRDDKRKKFHIILVARRIELEMPPSNLLGKIREFGVDLSFGIKAETIVQVHAEIQTLINNGYTEEEAPPVI